MLGQVRVIVISCKVARTARVDAKKVRPRQLSTTNDFPSCA